jgi:hypothetical protein
LLELLDPEPQDKLMVDDCGIELGRERSITVSRACELFCWMRAKTARRALRRLVKDGWLECVKPKLAAIGERFVLKKSRWGRIVPDPLVQDRASGRYVPLRCNEHKFKRLHEERKTLRKEMAAIKEKLKSNHDAIRDLSVDTILAEEMRDP